MTAPNRLAGPRALVVLTSVLVLQKTKHAMLPRTQTTCSGARRSHRSLAALVLAVRVDARQPLARRAARLGTLANNYYEPRRAHLTQGFAIGFGVLRRSVVGDRDVERRLRRHASRARDARARTFEVAALCGALTGALVGGVIGLAVGHGGRRRIAADAVEHSLTDRASARGR